MTSGEFIYDPPQDPYLSILFEDEAIIAVSKPPGLLSVRGRLPEHQDSVQSRLQEQYQEVEVVHRLDMDTSGVLVFARSKDVQKHLHAQFSKREVKKLYVAIVHGCPEKPEGIIDLPIRCDWPNRPKQIVCYRSGKESTTRYLVERLDKYQNMTRITLEPVTGRSHQIRIHMASIGYPVVGDRFYSDLGVSDRLYLHAHKLGLAHPTNGYAMHLEDPCPF